MLGIGSLGFIAGLTFILAAVVIHAIRRNNLRKAAQATAAKDRRIRENRIVDKLHETYKMGLSGETVRVDYDIPNSQLRLILGPICLEFSIYPVAGRSALDPKWVIFIDLPNGERHEVTNEELCKLRAKALDMQDEFVRSVRVSHIPTDLLRPTPVAS